MAAMTFSSIPSAKKRASLGRRHAGDPLDVREQVAVAVADRLADVGIVERGGVHLELRLEHQGIGAEQLPVGAAHGLERLLAAETLCRLLHRLEGSPEAPAHDGEMELALGAEEPEQIRLRDPGPPRDRLRGGAVEAGARELLERGGEHVLAPLLRRLPRRRRHRE